MGSIETSHPNSLGRLSNMHILIIGAGPTGLLVAQGLKQRGIACTVFEKAHHQHAREWAVTLHWAMDIVRSLLPPELSDRLEQAQTNSWEPVLLEQEELIFTNGQTGSNLHSIPFPGLREMNVRKMRNLFCEGIEVKTGKTLTGISTPEHEDYVEAIFSDGSKYQGTTLLGSDGGGSFVRRFVVGPSAAQAEVLPYTMMNTYSKYDACYAQKLKSMLGPIVNIGIHPKGMYCRLNVVDIPSLERPEDWVFQILSTWPKQDGDDANDTAQSRLADLKKRALDWAEPQKSAILNLADDIEIPRDSMKQWRPAKYDNRNGRIALAGDAAHATTFQRGQGMNNAVSDAAHYVRALCRLRDDESTKLGYVISEYQNEVTERGAKELDASQESTRATHKYKEFVEFLKNASLGPSSESALA